MPGKERDDRRRRRQPPVRAGARSWATARWAWCSRSSPRAVRPGTTAPPGPTPGPAPRSPVNRGHWKRRRDEAGAEGERGLRAVDATLPPLTTPARTVHTLTLTVEEVVLGSRPVSGRSAGPTTGRCPPHPPRPRGRHLRSDLVNHGSMGHSIDFTPASAHRTRSCAPSPGRHADLSLHGLPRGDLDVPLLHHADVRAHRRRHARCRRHRADGLAPWRAAMSSSSQRCMPRPAPALAPRYPGRRRQGGGQYPGCGDLQRDRQPGTTPDR